MNVVVPVGMTDRIELPLTNCAIVNWPTTLLPLVTSVARIVAKTGRSEQEARASLESMSPQRRMIQPEEVAHLVAMLCAPDARGIHGQAILVDGGQVMK